MRHKKCLKPCMYETKSFKTSINGLRRGRGGGGEEEKEEGDDEDEN